MRFNSFVLLFASLFLFSHCYAQRGKDGAKVVAAANTIVNEYIDLTANINVGDVSIQVSASSLNFNGRFASSLAAGDLLFIYQTRGASTTACCVITWGGNGQPRDSTLGQITNYNNAGHYEFAEVQSVPNGTTINLSCPLTNAYTSGFGLTQVIRVPRYSSLTINSPGVLTAQAWNGITGGVQVTEVKGNTVINAGASIDLTALGFRGGVKFNVSPETTSNNEGTNNNNFAAEKGEGIAGYQNEYNIIPWTGAEGGGRYGKNSVANGGGGGCSIDAGGGGGANGGNPNPNVWNGRGFPDLTGAYATAWALENTWVPLLTSPGGGRGGYKFANSAQDPMLVGPGNASWGGDKRSNEGGLGGRPVDYSTGLIFMGGGGGAGQGDNNYSGSGGNGGGLIYLLCYGTVSGSGQIVSNGNAGTSAQGASGVNILSGKDGAGGGGAGGTIIVNSTVSGISLFANGGVGGDQIMTHGTFSGGWEVQGPGGGGGGGYIAVQSGVVAQQVNGGVNGTTNSQLMIKFPPNGATAGAAGSMNQVITNYTISVRDTAICGSGGSVTLTAALTGTVPSGATLTWYDAAVGGTILGTGTTYTTPVLATNTTYYIGSCPGFFRVPLTVTISPPFTCTLTATNASCSVGGSVTSVLSGGTSAFTYLWSNAATGATLSNVSAANYTLTVIDAVGCTATSNAAVGSSGSTVDLSTISKTNPLCSGQASGDISVTPTGGASPYTYSWSNTITTAANNNILSGTYTVSVTDKNGCTSSTTAILTDPPPLGLSTSSSPASCTAADGQVSVTATGGSMSYAYSWMPGGAITPTVNGLAAGSYTISVTDTYGCTKTQTVTISSVSGFTAGITKLSDVSCFGGSDGSATITASSGTLPYTYTWQPNGGTGATVTDLIVGTQTVVVSDANGCSSTLSIAIAQPVAALSANISTTPSSCGNSNGSALVNVTGGTSAYTYSWSTLSTGATITNIVGGVYSITVTDSKGCTTTASGTVGQSSVSALTLTAVDSTICKGDSTKLTAGGFVSYNWLPSNGLNSTTGSVIFAAPSSLTVYTVTATDAGGCTSSASLTINVNPLPTPSVASAITICSGMDTLITASGGVSYSWGPSTGLNSTNTASVIAHPTVPTVYTVTVTDANMCSATATTAINVNTLPTASVAGSLFICTGQSTTLTASGGVSYAWSTGSGIAAITVSPVLNASYVLTVTDANGCSTLSTVLVTVSNFPVASAGNDTTICHGASIQLKGGTGLNYNWSSGLSLSDSTVANPIASPTGTTKYILTVSNGSNCSATDTVIVTVSPALVVTAGADRTINLGGSTTLGAAGGIGYSWSPAASLNNSLIATPVATPTQTTTYTVTVSDASGCSTTSTVTVFVDIICSDVFVPNAFSPNGDEENDILYVRGNCIEVLYFAVYDRWGEMVFNTTNKDNGWDGIFRGIKADTGVYGYYLKATLLNGQTVDKTGNISLVR